MYNSQRNIFCPIQLCDIWLCQEQHSDLFFTFESSITLCCVSKRTSSNLFFLLCHKNKPLFPIPPHLLMSCVYDVTHAEDRFNASNFCCFFFQIFSIFPTKLFLFSFELCKKKDDLKINDGKTSLTSKLHEQLWIEWQDNKGNEKFHFFSGERGKERGTNRKNNEKMSTELNEKSVTSTKFVTCSTQLIKIKLKLLHFFHLINNIFLLSFEFVVVVFCFSTIIVWN